MLGVAIALVCTTVAFEADVSTMTTNFSVYFESNESASKLTLEPIATSTELPTAQKVFSTTAVASLLFSAAKVASAGLFTLIAAIAVVYLLLPATEKKAVRASLDTLSQFYKSMWYYLVVGGKFRDCPYFTDSTQARCHVYSLATIFYLWDRPHYRNGTFQEDMLKNLRDVAIPGTGVPLSLVAMFKPVAYAFVLVGYPIIAFVIAVVRGHANVAKVAGFFSEHLVEPQDWFSFWRLNCRLASLHAAITGETDYELEDKWKFLTIAEERNVAVTPYMKVSGIVCKHRNEEGGLGFESFENAAVGGDWIIQKKLDNSDFLNSMLPSNAPLSTFRIISSSRGGLKSATAKRGEVTIDDVEALSCVWRAGRAKAKTDHSAILFNMNPKTGEIKRGTTNVHWYQRGLSKIFTTPYTSEQDVTHHPDSGASITGVQVPNMTEMMDFVRDAHLRLIPHVPLCGWDVALTAEGEMLLLEGNFSCNFFRGDFDQESYFKFVSDYFVNLEERITA